MLFVIPQNRLKVKQPPSFKFVDCAGWRVAAAPAGRLTVYVYVLSHVSTIACGACDGVSCWCCVGLLPLLRDHVVHGEGHSLTYLQAAPGPYPSLFTSVPTLTLFTSDWTMAAGVQSIMLAAPKPSGTRTREGAHALVRCPTPRDRRQHALGSERPFFMRAGSICEALPSFESEDCFLLLLDEGVGEGKFLFELRRGGRHLGLREVIDGQPIHDRPRAALARHGERVE